MSSICFIGARGGSKGVRGKNIRKMGKLPLIAHTIKASLESDIFKHVIVSTENDEIAKIAKSYGAEVPFVRPKKLATDTAGMVDVMIHGIDLGGGVGCISSTLAKRKNVEKIYCIELVEEAVTMCQPIVKHEILKESDHKVISVVGDFDNLDLENNSIDFAVSWDSMHHSMDLIKTLKECKRVLKKNGIFIIVDRAHNNSTPNSEIERMLNIVYDENFLTKFYRPKGTILTRKENGEHEHRFFEWKNFFDASEFELIDSVVIKTESDENRKLKNDNNVNEIFVNYNLGAFGNRKVVFVLRSI